MASSHLTPFNRIVELDVDAPTEDEVSHAVVLPHRDEPQRPPHRSKQKTKCSICDLVICKKILPRHIRTVYATAPPGLFCCGISFARPDTLRRHQQERHSGNDNTMLCETCGSRVCYRALREHRQSQKCKDARRTPEELVLREGGVRNSPQPPVSSMIEPLLIVANLHRSSLLAWWSAYAPLRHETSHPVEPPEGRLSAINIMIGRALASVSSYITCENHQLALGQRMIEGQLSISPDRYSEILRLRGVALHQTLEMVRQVTGDDAPKSSRQKMLDDSIIAVSLLSTVDEFIFGRGSWEQTSQAKGFSALWRSYDSLFDTFVPAYDNLLEAAWQQETTTDVMSILECCCPKPMAWHPLTEIPMQIRSNDPELQTLHFWNDLMPTAGRGRWRRTSGLALAKSAIKGVGKSLHMAGKRAGRKFRKSHR